MLLLQKVISKTCHLFFGTMYGTRVHFNHSYFLRTVKRQVRQFFCKLRRYYQSKSYTIYTKSYLLPCGTELINHQTKITEN